MAKETQWEAHVQAATAQSGMVAAKHRLAAQAGLEVLQAGGNAVDAAVATAFAAGVVEPPMSGVGGGGYMSIFLRETQQQVVVAFPMQAPQAANPDMWELVEGYDNELFGWRLVKDNANIHGYKSIAIPGMVAGMAAALEQFGTIGLDRAVAPAIRLAEEGYSLSWFETMWQAQDLELLNRFPATAATFLRNGYPHRLPYLTEPGAAGMLRQPELGATLRAIAENGPAVLYGGKLGEQIADHVRQNGGILSADDLAQYEATVHVESVLGTYRGANVIGMRGGTGAPTVMGILNILENFDVRASGHNSADYLHAFIEVLRPSVCRSLCVHGGPNARAGTPSTVSFPRNTPQQCPRRSIPMRPKQSARPVTHGNFRQAAARRIRARWPVRPPSLLPISPQWTARAMRWRSRKRCSRPGARVWSCRAPACCSTTA